MYLEVGGGGRPIIEAAGAGAVAAEEPLCVARLKLFYIGNINEMIATSPAQRAVGSKSLFIFYG